MSNHHETCHIWSSDQAEQTCQTAFPNSKPFGRDSQSNLSAKPGRLVESCQYQHYISTGQKCCPIIVKLAIFDLQTKLNKRAKQLFLIPNRLAVTANQTWRQSRLTGNKPVLSKSWTYHSQTWYIDSWHHSGDSQTIWWPLTSGGRQTTMTLFTIPPTYNLNCNSYWIRWFMKHLQNVCLLTLCLC